MVSSFVKAFLGAGALVSHFSGALAQSSLGTSSAPEYPYFLGDGSSGSPAAADTTTANTAATPPWAPLSAATNPYETTPTTNYTQSNPRKYSFTVNRNTITVNGKSKQAILVNGQFPGPTIEANWGDWLSVTVKNSLPDEGTSLHWHGLLQKGTQSEDGVPGIDQCPIAPADSRTYLFQADLYGSSWWHSHYSAQYASGLFGPMLIHGPLQPGVNYTNDVGPVILSDYAYATYESIVQTVVEPNSPTGGRGNSDISLIDGKTNAVFNFQSGKSYRMRLTNTAADATYIASIDDHEFTVIAHDFVPVQPYVTKNISLGVAQRADIIVNATGKAGAAYWFRSTGITGAAVTNKTALAAIYYQGANQKLLPNTTATPIDISGNLFPDTSVGVPYCSIAPPTPPKTPTNLLIQFQQNATGSNLWYVDNSTFRVNYDEPVLLEAAAGNFSYPSTWNVYNHGNDSSVRIITYNTAGVQHPMHLHGHNFQIVAQGYGKWNGVPNVAVPKNPPRRDVYMLNAAQTTCTAKYNPADPTFAKTDLTGCPYIVVDYKTDNPGVWPYHCHIAWHVSAGLYTTQIELASQIGKQPADTKTTCDNWMTWQKTHIVDQIDSGEKIKKMRMARRGMSFIA